MWVGDFCIFKCTYSPFGVVPVQVTFKLKNVTDHTILIPAVGGRDIFVTLDTGVRMYAYTATCSWNLVDRDIPQQQLGSQDELSWTWAFEACEGPFNNNVKSFIVQMPHVGDRFPGAQWRGIVPR